MDSSTVKMRQLSTRIEDLISELVTLKFSHKKAERSDVWIDIWDHVFFQHFQLKVYESNPSNVKTELLEVIELELLKAEDDLMVYFA